MPGRPFRLSRFWRLAVPATGFSAAPTLIALFLYGLLPIFENTVSGIRQVNPSILDAADGMGHELARSGSFRWNCRSPCRSILEGLKVATVINIGTGNDRFHGGGQGARRGHYCRSDLRQYRASSCRAA